MCLQTKSESHLKSRNLTMASLNKTQKIEVVPSCKEIQQKKNVFLHRCQYNVGHFKIIV